MPRLPDGPTDIATPYGPARAHIRLPGVPPRSLLVLGHGAGGGIDAPDLSAVAGAVTARGAAVVLLEQPYRVAGRRAPAPANQLDVAWVAVCAELTGRLPGVPLVTGGRSSGARVACRTAALTGAVGVLALAFPLRPPGSLKDRTAELAAVRLPVLCVNGSRDPFGVPAPTRRVQVVVVPGADHGLRRDLPAVTAAATRWLGRRRWLTPVR